MSNKCQAIIQQGIRKGEQCNNITDEKYCNKHIRYLLIDKSLKEGIKYCDISRGCFTVLENNQIKCSDCLHKARINDRKRGEKKRSDKSLCLDCGVVMTNEIRAKGKNDKELRRCKICYDKLLKIEENREKRTRNYNHEGFKNKYVVWNSYIKGAKQRNLDFKLSKTLFNELISKSCFYCNYYNSQEIIGIDRIDNNKGYIEENVVPCCKICNMAKGTNHPQEFIDKIYSIYIYKVKKEPISTDFINKWYKTYLSKSTPTFMSYSKSANSRNIEFKLTKDDFNNIINKSCYLCGLITSDINTNGIDRFDNNKGYVIENCNSCCGHCNLMKKDLTYDNLIKISEAIYNNYHELSVYFNKYDIKVRNSKVEKREQKDNIIIGEKEDRYYKSCNEIISPISQESIIIKNELNNIINKSKQTKDTKSEPPKQWKVKQIHDAISTNNENTYKEHCEQNNNIDNIADWNTKWVTFILSVKEKTLEESEEIIKEFVEDLRRIRHNELCYNKNHKLIYREDREQWPSGTVVRAFIDGKMNAFKNHTENMTNENPDDPKWQKRWNDFITNLESNKDDEDMMKNICSKFMTAQRAQKYRRNKKNDAQNENENQKNI
jgi:hypothetical protein